MPIEKPPFRWFGSASRSPDTSPLPARMDADPRVRVVTPGVPGHRGDVVIYWAQMARRARQNGGLSYAIAEANARKLPLLVYEALRVDYPYASDRFHTFVLEGARGEAARYRERGAHYVYFLPKTIAEARGVLAKLTKRAALVVTDDYPSFVIPGHLRGLAAHAECPVIAFDDNIIAPLSLFPKEEYAARTLRPKMHRVINEWLRPIEENVAKKAANRVDLPFEPFDVENADMEKTIAKLPIDHDVYAVPELPGGSEPAHRRLSSFVRNQLGRYLEDHNHPDLAVTSALSPYLHFGMIGAREIALALRDFTGDVGARDNFLEQLIVRRGLAFNLAATNPRRTSLDALPDWAKKTLKERQNDRREHIVSRADLEAARSPDAVWNAAQRELVRTGVIHNYLRMLWGKCVMTWKATPEEAFDDLVYLNDKYAMDGRDPNTYTNILWCFGKHDRPWGPARPIFGTVRYMSTAAAQRKLEMGDWLNRWSREQ